MNKLVGAKTAFPEVVIIQTNQFKIYCRIFENTYQLRPKIIAIISNNANFKKIIRK